MIGIVFFANTLVIVLAQLPIAHARRGRRRMPTLALLGSSGRGAWVLVPLAGDWVRGAAAVAVLVLAITRSAIGECLHGTVQAPSSPTSPTRPDRTATWRFPASW